MASLAMITELAMSPRGVTGLLNRFGAQLGPEKHLHRLEGWLVALDRGIMDAQYPRHPSMKKGGCIRVNIDSDQFYAWHDWTVGKARTVGHVPSIADPGNLSLPHAGHVDVDLQGMKLGPWVEEHNLVPGMQVLSNRDDIRDYLGSQSRQ
jgi:hypothetical protein